MHKIVGFAALALATATLMGCQQAPAPAVASRSVLDVHPVHKAAPTFAMSPQRVTPPTEPQSPVVTAPVVTATPAPAAPAAKPEKADKKGKNSGKIQQASAKNSYKVKKGDTLYHIAKAEYGDGKKWTQIASANPGVSPHSLKAGQTLVIP